VVAGLVTAAAAVMLDEDGLVVACAGAAEARLAPITAAERTPKSFFTSVFLCLRSAAVAYRAAPWAGTGYYPGS